jgi:hypothetical protein
MRKVIKEIETGVNVEVSEKGEEIIRIILIIISFIHRVSKLLTSCKHGSGKNAIM